MTTEFMLISHNPSPSCQIHGERRQIPSVGTAEEDSVVLVDWRRRDNIKWKNIVVDLGGIDTEWCMMKMSYGGGMRGRKSMIHQSVRGVEVEVLKGREETLTRGMIAEKEMTGETEAVDENEEEVTEIDLIGEIEEEEEEEEIGIDMMIGIEIEDTDS